MKQKKSTSAGQSVSYYENLIFNLNSSILGIFFAYYYNQVLAVILSQTTCRNWIIVRQKNIHVASLFAETKMIHKKKKKKNHNENDNNFVHPMVGFVHTSAYVLNKQPPKILHFSCTFLI